MAPEPLVRRREPEERRRRDPLESTLPADHIGTFPAKETAARKELGEEDGTKETEKVELGDGQVWFEPEAKRTEPRGIVEDEKGKWRRRRRRRG